LPNDGSWGGRATADRPSERTRARAWLALDLALTGGAVDGIGFVILYHVFTAHMSGNSIAAAVYTGQGDWASAVHRAFPIPVFVLGVMLGAALCEWLARRRVRPVLAAAFGLEAVLLALFVLVARWDEQSGRIPRDPAWQFYAIAALPALAMGVQSAALRRVGAVKVRTTYITGMLTNAAEEAVACLYGIADRSGEDLRAAFRRGSLFAGIWVAYVLGAVIGVWAEARVGPAVLAVPVAGLVVVAVWDLVRPMEMRGRADWKV
jgi:uncharacterized membrane protein YoaK (UPF0700 family)